MPKRTARDLSSDIHSASMRNRYPHIARLTSRYDQNRRTRFLDDVEAFAHVMEDTIQKVVVNGPGNEQTQAYLAMLRVAIDVLEDTHFGGSLSVGGADRKLEGQWSDEP